MHSVTPLFPHLNLVVSRRIFISFPSLTFSSSWFLHFFLILNVFFPISSINQLLHIFCAAALSKLSRSGLVLDRLAGSLPILFLQNLVGNSKDFLKTLLLWIFIWKLADFDGINGFSLSGLTISTQD